MKRESGVDYSEVVPELYARIAASEPSGAVASYIPALERVPPDQFAVCVEPLDGDSVSAGDAEVSFSIQSITKVLTAAMVISREDILLWERVGVEPSGRAFDSLVQLEFENGIPRNPLINAGAIVVADELIKLYDDPKATLLAAVREMAGDDDIHFDIEVAESELETADTNRALAHLLRAQGNLRHDVETVLDLYCHQCALAMSTKQLARVFLLFANGGVVPWNERRLLSEEQARRINSIMLTSGFYDQAGEFAYQVGLPGKSGVGGGIVVVAPGEASIAVWSPRLNAHGNSVRGIETLKELTNATGLTVF
ncbi:MAG: glutaminase [Verrucomicrobiota bacterium]